LAAEELFGQLKSKPENHAESLQHYVPLRGITGDFRRIKLLNSYASYYIFFKEVVKI
jgi:hypothetical protein